MFKINRKLLQTELTLLVQIAGQKNVIPALETIRFDVKDDRGVAATLTASNADVALFTSVEAEGDSWLGCIPARQLSDLIRFSNAEEITFTPQGNHIEIIWGRSRHRLPVIEYGKFPNIHAPVGGASGTLLNLKTTDLIAALERVLPCASRYENNKWMTQGVKLEAKEGQLQIVATNTHRLGVATIPCDGELDLFVPLKAAELLPKMKSEDGMIWRDAEQAVFNFGPRTIIARLMTGTFPNWKAFMPEYLPLNASFLTEEMTGALKRADVTRNATFKEGVGKVYMGVVLVFGKEEVVIDTRHSDVYGRSEESVNITSNLNGELVYMGMNPDYLADFLRFAGPTTECFLKDGNSVLKMTDGSNFEYVVVPQRV